MSLKSNYANGDEAWNMKRFPKIIEETGELGVIEFGAQLDFMVKRVFFLRNIKPDTSRGFHAHKELKQIIFCLNGSFTIHLDNGHEKQEIQMTADDNCLYIDGKVWREMNNFLDHTVMMVLCDREYRFDEVVRDYSLFKKNIKGMTHAI